MAEIPFRKLLSFLSKVHACEELRLIPGETVIGRLSDGNVVRMETERQTAESIAECLRSVIPARSQEEIQVDGHTEFFIDHNDNERYRVVVTGRAVDICVVIRRSQV